MSGLAIATIVIVLVSMDLFIVGALFAQLRTSMWRPLAEAHPARQPAVDAVRREFQSISVGLFNLGLSVHLSVDAEHLHVEPAAVLRWMRLGPMSLPWEAMHVVKRTRRGRITAVRIGLTTLKAPAWALELAEPAEA